MKSLLIFFVLFASFLIIPVENISAQQSDRYDAGTVWTLTFVRTEANQNDTYLNGLADTWVASMEEAKKEGLILNYKILQGMPANEDDFNLVLMIENKSMSQFDPNKEREAKFDAIQKRVQERMGEKFQKTVENYDDIRNLLGSKLMREIHLKK